MDESPEKQVLKTLTLCTVKALSKIEKLLNEAPDKKRDKKIQRITKELEVCNDEVMRNVLNLSAEGIAKLKTGRGLGSSGGRSSSPNQQRIETPFQQLMRHHAQNIVGPIPDPGAQGQAIKWILESFTPELAIRKYNSQMEESQGRYRVSWLTVKRDIGRIQSNGVRPLDATERNAARFTENSEFIENLRGGSGPDYH